MSVAPHAWPWPTSANVAVLPAFLPVPKPVTNAATGPDADFYKDASLVGVFDSMEEFMHAALHAPHADRACYREWLEGTDGEGAAWYGLEGEPGFSQERRNARVKTNDVCALVSRGWQRGADRLEQAFASLECDAKPRTMRRVRIRTDQGDSVDIHRVNSGQLDTAWDRCAKRSLPGAARVTLVYDAIDFGGASSDAMFWRGAAVAFLADRLTQAGYAVRVISGWSGGVDSGTAVCRVQVKPFDAPLDLPTLAAGVALPAFFRSIGHAWGSGWAPKHSGSGFYVYALVPQPGERLMPNSRAVYDQRTAAAWLTQQFAELAALALQ